MSTNCKLIIGYIDNMGWWQTISEYVRWKDGYSEAVLPTLKKFTSVENGVDIDAFNKSMEYVSWEFEEVIDGVNLGQMNYHYYIDESNRNEIKCSVLKEDGEFFNKYHVMNMMIEQELVL